MRQAPENQLAIDSRLSCRRPWACARLQAAARQAHAAGGRPQSAHDAPPGGEGDDRPLDAHLFLGLFSYRIVNTIPSKLRQGRKRLLPDKDSPKAVHAEGAAATEAVNALGENEDFYR